jgi:hypothetical protein
MKVPGYKYYTSENIFKTAKLWLNKTIEVFNGNKSTPVDGTSEYEL